MRIQPNTQHSIAKLPWAKALLGGAAGAVPLLGGLTTGVGACCSMDRFTHNDEPELKVIGLCVGTVVGTALNIWGMTTQARTGNWAAMIPSGLAGALAWACAEP